MPRVLKNHPGYFAAVSGILALAVSINLLVFGIVNAMWIRPLPVFQPERVVTILQSGMALHRGAGVASLGSPTLEVFDRPLAGQIVTTGFGEAFIPKIALPHAAAPVETLGVTPHYFAVLGVPVRGRTFSDADEETGADDVAIISDRLWATAFGRNPAVLDSVVAATPRPLRIVGIAAPGFEGARRGERAQLWVPIRVVRELAPAYRLMEQPTMMVFARLGTGQTPTMLDRRYRERSALKDAGGASQTPGPRVVPLTEVFGTSDSPTLLIREHGTVAIVSGLALLVLLGACSTLAAFVLSHYERRRSEFALKLALGATPALIAGELARELGWIAMVGTAGALAGALFALSALPALSLPGGVNLGRLDLSIDWRLCAVALSVTLVTLAAASAVPLRNAASGRLAGEIATGQATSASLRARLQLLALQVCATTVVLISAAVFVQTVLNSYGGAAGFDLDRTVFVNVQERSFAMPREMRDLEPHVVDWRARGLEGRARLTSLLKQVPLVHGVAGGKAPIGADALGNASTPMTVSVGTREERLLLGVLPGTPNLLSVLGVPLLSGRGLTPADVQTVAPRPVVITRSLAARLWPAENPLGQTFSIRELRLGRCVVVGIAGDFAFGTLARPIAGVIATAEGDSDFVTSSLVLATEDPVAVVGAVNALLSNRVIRVATGREVVANDIARQRLGAWVFSGFGLVALLLGVCGVFGLVAYFTDSRRREFGVRMALGATLPDLVRHGLVTALRPVVVGLACGLGIGAGISRLFASVLIGMDSLDLGTYVGAGGALLACATLAALAGSWRLRSVAPTDALRGY